MLTTFRSLSGSFFGQHRYTQRANIEDGIKFLEQKGVLATSSLRGTIFSLLRDPSLSANSEERRRYEAARERLLRLISTEEETHSDVVPSGLHLWNETEFPGYKKEDVFFLKHPAALSQRYQLSGLCYMHGPAMVQHYALAHNNHSVPMIDLLKFIKEHFTAEQLERHIFDNQGGDSSTFLKSILQANTVLVSPGLPHQSILSLFRDLGPALVSKFKVHEDFMKASVHHHYGKPSGKFIGYHAMTFVGHRLSDNGTSYFLLQNWWEKKQFVEVDADYLKASGAYFTFIETPQTGIPDTFSYTYGKYHELEAVDKPEGQANEMASE
eukprot:TRINITY_DN283_c0_g1_i15.p1 TRINITY_DN283_c0_g1~~TRINITY_DN283_c0_g1_i15.p1  ORF type:complete len:325 (+),score=56.83 TRINITY_DN283_c0_g1_i15:181-1155(+)